MKNILPVSASFLMTEGCNLSCTYCFEKHKQNKIITDEVIKKGLDYLFENAKKSNLTSINVTIFGGEPSLVPEKIKVLLEYGLKRQNETGIQMATGIITNGVLLTQELQDILNEYKNKLNLGVQLSVDGIEEVQNMYRIYKDGQGSFGDVEKNIPIYKEIFKENPKQLSIHGCINKQTLSYLYENYKFFKDEWKFERIWFMPIHEEEWTLEDVDIYKEQLTKIANHILEDMKKNNRIDELKDFSPFSKLFDGGNFVSSPCRAGSSYISITSDGDIYPCHHFYFNDKKQEMRIGDVFNGVDDEKRKPFLDLTNESMTCGSNCECYNCYRCLGANWAKNGDMKKQIQGNYCKMAHIEHDICEYMKSKAKELKLMQENKKEEFSIDEGIDILAKTLKVVLVQLSEIQNTQKILLDKIERLEK